MQLDPVRHVHLPGSTVRMTNYVSLGVDALVTLNFHKTRESPHYLWSSRLVNKARNSPRRPLGDVHCAERVVGSDWLKQGRSVR